MPEQDTSSFFFGLWKVFQQTGSLVFFLYFSDLKIVLSMSCPQRMQIVVSVNLPHGDLEGSAVIIASYLDVLWCSLVLLCQEGARGSCSIRKRNCKPSKVTKPAKAMISAHNALSWNGSFRNHQVQPTSKLIMNISMDGEALSNLFQMFYHSHYKKLLPYIESKSIILSFKDITPCPISTCPRKTFLSLSFYKFSLGTGRLL